MSTELHDPPLRVTVEGMRWDGENFTPTGTSATFDLHGTDSGDAAQVLRLLRSHLATRLRMRSALLAMTLEEHDFDAPNAPTEHDVGRLEEHARSVLNAIEALRELSAEVIDDDEEATDAR